MKNPILAFLLAFFPGGGLLYLGKVRGLFYTIIVFGLLFFSVFIDQIVLEDIFIIFAFGGLLMYIINLIDTAITASKFIQGSESNSQSNNAGTPSKETERFYTIILSVIPGLGHFQLGLVNRGFTFIVAFLGLGVMVLFVAALTHRSELLLFLAFLPVLWVYSFFDAMQLLNHKQNGETLVDRSLLEDFEERREDGKKSKSIAIFLSIFPGAGHLYLGLQRRGIQIMATFLFTIYVLDVLRLGFFLFLIPIIWFYSFFDGLQKASKYGIEPIEDTPIISYFENHQKWVGIGLILLGCYYLFANIVIPVFSPLVSQYIGVDLFYWFDTYFQTIVVCLFLIGGGIKLLFGSKRQSDDHEKGADGGHGGS